jgi:hypothetical protein
MWDVDYDYNIPMPARIPTPQAPPVPPPPSDPQPWVPLPPLLPWPIGPPGSPPLSGNEGEDTKEHSEHIAALENGIANLTSNVSSV